MFPGKVAAVAFALALSACASDNAEKPRGPASDPDAGPSGGDAGEPSVCAAPGYADGTNPAPFAGLSATVVDESGNPAGRVTAQACGINLCLNGKTDARGYIAITERGSLKKAAFKYGGGQSYARFALALDLTSGDALALGEQRTIAFDPPEDGAPLAPGRTATSRGASLTLAPNAATSIDVFDFDTPDLRRFRSAEIPEAAWPDAVDRSLGFALVVALTPSGGEICPRAKLSLANTAALPAGARVEFFVHGTEVSEAWAPYGGWAKVSGGAVTSDGASIETDPDGGIPILSVVGVRLAE
jgi:hypothetical protein